MYPDFPAITIGAAVRVHLRSVAWNEDGPAVTTFVQGNLLSNTDFGVCLGRDMLHVEAFIPAQVVAYIKVLDE